MDDYNNFKKNSSYIYRDDWQLLSAKFRNDSKLFGS